MRSAWQLYFSRPNKRVIFFSSIFGLALVLISFIYFLTFNENRIGYIFNDPVLNAFAPIALSEAIFFITYFLVVYGVIISFRYPALFVSLLQSYTLMTLIRMFCMYILPLESPASIIPLKDSFLQNSFYSGRENLKDLFFSGHTATVFLFAFAFKKRVLKLFFAIGGTVVGIFVVLQHVHYSIDVIVAPAFAYFSVYLQRKIDIQ